MSASIEHLKIGDTRQVTEILEPGTYGLGNDRHIVLKRRASIVRTDRWQYEYESIKESARWKSLSYDHSSLRVLPTWWERVRAFLSMREPPVPRAIVLTEDSGSRLERNP